MTRLPRANPRPPEHINNPRSSAVGEFLGLLVGVAAAVAIITAVLAFAAGRLAPYLPYEWEVALLGDIHLDSPYPAAERTLRTLAGELAGPSAPSVQVHLVEEPAPNAFATLGGHIVVTSGLVERLSSENALAIVLAHEIAHVAHRDPIRTLSRGAVISLVWALVSGTGSDPAARRVLGQAGLLTVLGFGRAMERQADRAALAALERHYGHTAGAAELFERMLAAHDEPAWQQWFRTHPRTRDRLRMIGDHPAADEGELTPMPRALRALRGAGA